MLVGVALVVQRLQPGRTQNRLAQPLQAEEEQQSPDEHAQVIDRQRGERRRRGRSTTPPRARPSRRRRRRAPQASCASAPTARTIVRASTASTAQARNTDNDSPISAPLMLPNLSIAGRGSPAAPMRYNGAMAPRETARKASPSRSPARPARSARRSSRRSSARARWGASSAWPAARSTHTRKGWKKVSYRRGDVLDRDAVRSARARTPTWSCTWRS